jgi:phage-related protein
MASGTELAKAYVQIIPSAEGIKGKITEELGGEAASAGTSAGQSFGGNLVGVLKKVLVAAGIGTVIKESISEGAALEQSIGGIETLFKDSADTMKTYAAEAYKTAGMSANEYMETATGFAASLLQGLGGDTAQAAEVSNMAITDMSDNANKMGTDMQSIQNAYQGFAKQNYTMLDNLKLGYGGTRTEMERLLSDAQKISGVEYNIDNLSDVYEAIHVIQGDLDITGTTAKEAATTLSGSMASMKSAFTNVLGNLALGEDIGPALDGLLDSVFTFLEGNLLPMVGNVMGGLPKILTKTMSGVIQMMNKASKNTAGIVQMGTNIVTELVDGILEMAPYLVEAALNLIASFGNALITTDWAAIAEDMISTLQSSMDQAGLEILGTDGSIMNAISQAITSNLPGMLEKGVEIITNLANGILANLPAIIESIGSILTQLVAVIMQNMPTILQAGVTLIENLAQGLINNLPAIITAIADIIFQLLATIWTYLPQILQTGIKLINELQMGVIQAIPQLIAKIPTIISNIKTEFLKFDWKSIGTNIIKGIANGIKAGSSVIVEAAKSAAKKALDAAKKFLGIGSPSKVMRDEVGRWIPAGIAEGIAENEKSVTSAMRKLTQQTAGTLQSELVMGINQGQNSLNHAQQNSQISQPGGYTQNITINSPTELSPSEVARQTRTATRNMVLSLKGV